MERQLTEPSEVLIKVPWGHVAGSWHGNRTVRPILALHGWQDNLGTWDQLIPLLPQHIGVLCIDFPGHGRSSKYPIGITYDMIDYVHIIIRIMKEYKWKQVSLMGHSMGGIIAFIYASLYPHTVDMIIQLDIITTPLRTLEYQMNKLVVRTEKLLIEDERLESMKKVEPPSYSYEQLEELLYKGSGKSVEKENCKYLLNRSINQSQLYPEKYYFSRDGRIKYYREFNASIGLTLEMIKRLKNIKYLLIRFKQSGYVLNDLVEILREINSNMEFYELDGTHHAHLNNADTVARIVVPFILRTRPVPLNTWSADDEEVMKEKTKFTYKQINKKSKL